MKNFKIILSSVFLTLFLSSCVYQENVYTDEPIRYTSRYENSLSLWELLSSYDLWYVDIHQTQGSASVEFLQKAFTVSFFDGELFANMNITGVGNTGNGLGIKIGSYDTFNTSLETRYFENISEFKIVQLTDNEIRLDDLNKNVSYYLIGYQKRNFDYDELFYDNIEFFLQEYQFWERVEAIGGTENVFDKEHFLKFLHNDNNTFLSSKDDFDVNTDRIIWDFEGKYEVKNYTNVNKTKVLTLYYDNNYTESFDINIISDNFIKLKHKSSNTTYSFKGKKFTQYLRNNNVNITHNKKNSYICTRERKRIIRENI